MGLLPFQLTKGEKVFLAVIVTFGICFIWMRTIEPIYRMSLWGALIIGGIVGWLIYKYA